MYATIHTLLFEHDLRLVVLAGVICALAAFAGISILHHARRNSRKARYVWLAVAAVAVGFGVWSTHFIAMLAYRTDMAVGYDLLVTASSLIIAIGIVGGGLWIAAIGEHRSDLALGGAVAGLGISAMHYTGMAALIVGGRIGWDPALLAASIILGMVLGSAAFTLSAWRPGQAWRTGAAGVMTLAIVTMHFTAMGAANLDNCYPIVTEGDATPANLSLAVGIAGILIVGLALGGLMLDLHERRRAARETDRMRVLADAAVEGLIITDDRRVVTANASFLRMIGAADVDIAGCPLDELFARTALAELLARPDMRIETELADARGRRIPIEAILRPVEFAGELRSAIAIRDLSARKKDEQQIRFLAHHDPLTGLANRATFNRQLLREVANARRLGQRFAVICLDLDRFKEVNDLFGHAAGDTMLKVVGECLAGVLEEGQTCARLGGDEFAIIIPDIDGLARAGRIAEAILEAFRAHNARSHSGAPLSASIGVALFPDNADTADMLVANADTALYRAKRDGRGVYRFFEVQMGVAVREKRLLENDLRNALARGEFSLVYQPQVNVQSGEVTGFEALVRWTHPTRGQIAPSTFIPVAEECGLILNIGDWVTRQACAEAAGWANTVTIAVNVSPVQLHAPGFVARLRAVLQETRLDPRRLEIEITETALIRDLTRTIATLDEVKALGVRIAMDDFGTGYSSLANLRAFAFDRIKMDQSFIRSVDRSDQSAAIVRAVLGLGSGLKLPVVAEGVEREEELEFLRHEACAEIQGYLFSRPGPIGDFAAVTSGRSRSLADPLPVMRLVAS
ncbi:EAL domain-containing protein [Devosia nitrariae]|uniref:Diguanylate cyclase n=1 Tax=Devosia nitrariae TaxID=2071872 RepID=A0ABQ5VZL5_9HYPH|nr:EAL domain-containing protein [Devosia nitrariae]GLQ53244.1 diguanylate cyclase [Devosia nitrariae]